MSSISVSRFVVSINADDYCGCVARVMNPHNMTYSTFLATFNIEYEAYSSTKDKTELKVTKISDMETIATSFVGPQSSKIDSRVYLSLVAR